ncbi:MAG: transposase [Planctomycetia bacterium]|nr:transposase [Planctomycetia bacterium]
MNNPREERGLVIAALCKLNKTPECWLVPSQSATDRTYRVNVEKQTCTCPDHQEAGFKCKHLYAVEFTVKREVHDDGSVTDTRSVTFTEKVTYKQDWPAYNHAQATEKRRLQILLNDLTRNLADPPRDPSRRGPKPHRTCDAIFSMAFKVYCGMSSRRSMTDIDDAHEQGHLTRPISVARLWGFFENPGYTPILKNLIALSAAPLRAVETQFAIDSSGFGSSRYERWYDKKYGITKLRCKWVKTHIACGVKTNVVTAVRILDEFAADSPQFIPLVKETRRTFEVSEVSADKAYGSLANFEEVADCGGQGFIAFKSDATGGAGGEYERAFHFFQFNRDEYMKQYHLRSNVESTFSAIKRKFGDSVMSKTDTAMTNEVLCKILCHNLTCLIQEQETLGIAPIFWKDDTAGIEDYRALLPMTGLRG